MALRELAQATKLPPSKIHRYLVSLCRSGLIEQDGAAGRYDLGPGALTLGLAGLGRLDAYRLADKTIRDLHEKTGLGVSVLAWGSYGPAVIRRVEPMRPVIATTRIGSPISVTSSASGRLFAAFLPPHIVEPIIRKEFAAVHNPTSMGRPINRSEFDKIVADARRRSIARVRGDFLSGFDAMSAPVFDQQGNIVITISLLAPSRTIDISFDGGIARALKKSANALSLRLGYRARAAD